MRTGPRLFVAGHDPERGGRLLYRGRVGRSVSLSDAGSALRLATLNALAAARTAVGSLAGFRCVVLTGFVVSATPRGLDPAILEDSLRLLATVLPAPHRPAVWLRAAQTLAGGMPVEVELLLEARPPEPQPSTPISRRRRQQLRRDREGAGGSRRSGARTN